MVRSLLLFIFITFFISLNSQALPPKKFINANSLSANLNFVMPQIACRGAVSVPLKNDEQMVAAILELEKELALRGEKIHIKLFRHSDASLDAAIGRAVPNADMSSLYNYFDARFHSLNKALAYIHMTEAHKSEVVVQAEQPAAVFATTVVEVSEPPAEELEDDGAEAPAGDMTDAQVRKLTSDVLNELMKDELNLMYKRALAVNYATIEKYHNSYLILTAVNKLYGGSLYKAVIAAKLNPREVFRLQLGEKSYSARHLMVKARAVRALADNKYYAEGVAEKVAAEFPDSDRRTVEALINVLFNTRYENSNQIAASVSHVLETPVSARTVSFLLQILARNRSLLTYLGMD